MSAVGRACSVVLCSRLLEFSPDSTHTLPVGETSGNAETRCFMRWLQLRFDDRSTKVIKVTMT